MLYVGLIAMGGLVYSVVDLVVGRRGKRAEAEEEKSNALFSSPLVMWFACIMSTALFIVLRYGISFIGTVFNALIGSADILKSGDLPNVFVSISELQVPKFAPEGFSQYFSGYVQAGQLYIVNGVGGLMIFILSVVALVWLSVHCFSYFRKDNELKLSSGECAMYAIVM